MSLSKIIYEFVNHNPGHTIKEIWELCSEIRENYSYENYTRTQRRLRDRDQLYSEKFGNEVFLYPYNPNDETSIEDHKFNQYIEKIVRNRSNVIRYLPLAKGGTSKTSGDYYKFRMFFEALLEVTDL